MICLNQLPQEVEWFELFSLGSCESYLKWKKKLKYLTDKPPNVGALNYEDW